MATVAIFANTPSKGRFREPVEVLRVSDWMVDGMKSSFQMLADKWRGYYLVIRSNPPKQMRMFP